VVADFTWQIANRGLRIVACRLRIADPGLKTGAQLPADNAGVNEITANQQSTVSQWTGRNLQSAICNLQPDTL